MKLIDRDELIGWPTVSAPNASDSPCRIAASSCSPRPVTGMDLPAAYQPGCDLQTAERALPLKKTHIESLRDVLPEAPDPRASNRSWPISTLLTLICMGLFAGRKSLASKEPKSEASKTEGELTAAKRLYQNVNLQGAVVTGDALHCERENIQLVVENNGDALFQLKGNQPPRGPKPSTSPPHMSSLVIITKQTRPTSREGGKEIEETVSHYLSTLVPHCAQHFARLVRGHWGGCEIRNLWVRDAAHFSWPAIFELSSMKTTIPYNMVCNNVFK